MAAAEHMVDASSAAADLTILSGPVATWYYNSQTHATSLLRTLHQLYLSCEFCDVHICVDSEVFQAHRNVLSAASPYFHAMFTSGLTEQGKDYVKIEDVSAKTFRLLLRFIYTGRLSRVNLSRSVICRLLIAVPVSSGGHLLVMLHGNELHLRRSLRCDMIRKKSLCFLSVGELEVTTDTCQDLLTAADMLRVSEVMEACCTFLQQQLQPANCIGEIPSVI